MDDRHAGDALMGTRADFYVGRGADAEWLGSVAWDGYPDGFAPSLFQPKDEPEWRQTVAAMFASREDATLPEMGWPWPWETSHTTDFAYALDDDTVYASCFGSPWLPATDWLAEDFDAEEHEDGVRPAFPDMSERKNVAMGKRSGLIVVAARTESEGA